MELRPWSIYQNVKTSFFPIEQTLFIQVWSLSKANLGLIRENEADKISIYLQKIDTTKVYENGLCYEKITMQANECVIGDYRAAISRRDESNRRYVFAMTLDGNCATNLFIRASFRNWFRNRSSGINRYVYDQGFSP